MFAPVFPIPDYQSGAVATYFADHSPPYPYYYDGQYNGTGLYNRNGRGIPDVAANGDNIAVYLRGNFTLEGGTSASAPIFAALVTRINEERIKAGKGPVGFINPTLYEHPEVSFLSKSLRWPSYTASSYGIVNPANIRHRF